MNETIRSDLFRYGGLSNIFVGKRIPGFRYTYYLRKAAKHKKYSLFGLYYRFIVKRLSYKYGFQIPVSTSIGKGLYIGHFGTIVINDQVKIGNHCNIAHSTTIGEASRGKYKGYPTISDHVWIGTGSVIVGEINIGNNVLIAPNSLVNRDIPSNSIVVGNPLTIIHNENATEGYICNIYNS